MIFPGKEIIKHVEIVATANSTDKMGIQCYIFEAIYY